jgi:hypothetical protein
MADGTLPAMGFFDKHREKIAFAGPDECWLWTAGKNDTGYGSVKLNGKARHAHRLAFEAANGDGSASGLVVRHRCDTPACVNPAHLQIGTMADNTRDMYERGRQPSQTGAANSNAKLTEADVRAIRAEYVRYCRRHGTHAIARKYGVGGSIISYIVNRKSWAHIDP